ncbi:hypothetical protein I4U23_029888 [Adineta vaga]|nr:hypothetical protein I4U23_029888 [Adineta vaga]
MSFEKSFPDEIILEICRYLHPIDIILSFAGLNHRLNGTISDFIRHIHLSSIISHEKYLYLIRTTLPSIWSLMQSLTIDNSQIPCLTRLFLDNTERILPTNLKRLCLFHLNTNEIYHFINRLMHQCVVEELIIECMDDDFVNQQELYGYRIAQMLVFHHPTLKSIELRGEILFDINHLSFLSLSNSDDLNLISNANGLSVLRRLTISLRSLSSLHLLLIYQPYLEYLNVHIGDGKSNYDYTITSFPPLSKLREFHFRSEDLVIKFDNLVELLTYFPNLKSLSIDLTTECRSFFDGDLLQILVQSLDLFQFSIARFSPPTSEEQTLSTFYTPFWLEIKKWYTQCYWHIDEDQSDADYFHIYSVPFSFTELDIYKCTNENLVSKEKFKPFVQVKRLELSETSDVNVIPFLKRCPNIQTICLNDVYDDEENYGTDEEEDMDQIDENVIFNDFQTINTSQSSLTLLPYVHHISVLALPDHDLGFFQHLLHVTPNLNRLSIYFDDLLEIVHIPQQNLCEMLQKRIYQLKINLDYLWLLSDIRRDIPKILRIFSRIKSLTISLHEGQKRTSTTVKELLINLFRYQTNLCCINIKSNSSTGFESIKKQGDIDLIKIWLMNTNDTRFKYENYLKNSVHIELNPSSLVIWL